MSQNQTSGAGHHYLLGRVEGLERSLRVVRLMLGSLVLVGVLGGIAAMVSPARAEDDNGEVFRVGGLVLVDKSGQTRGTWAVLDDGDVILTMNDEREKPRLVMLVDKVGHTEVTLLDGTGTQRGSWVAATSGQTAFFLADTKGKPRFGAKVEANAAYWQLNDNEGRTRAMCSVLTMPGVSKTEFGLYDKQAKRRIAIVSTSDGTPAIVFPDKANPMKVVGGWYVNDGVLVPLAKGRFAKALGGR